jgi:SAM-dependent methyltransferase
LAGADTGGRGGGFPARVTLAARDALLSRLRGVNWLFVPLLDAVKVPPYTRVLDVGGGDGGLLAELVHRGHVGTRELVDVAHGTDAYVLPYPDASFDVVFMLRVLAHLKDPALALAEARRVLAPGGRLVIAAHGPDHLAGLFTVSRLAANDNCAPEGIAFDIRLPVVLTPADQSDVARSYWRTVLHRPELKTWLHLSGWIVQAREAGQAG